MSAELHVKSDSIQLAYRRWRQAQIDRGWGLDALPGEQAMRSAAVIPSPGRANDPELANAWVFPSVDEAAARRPAAETGP